MGEPSINDELLASIREMIRADEVAWQKESADRLAAWFDKQIIEKILKPLEALNDRWNDVLSGRNPLPERRVETRQKKFSQREVSIPKYVVLGCAEQGLPSTQSTTEPREPSNIKAVTPVPRAGEDHTVADTDKSGNGSPIFRNRPQSQHIHAGTTTLFGKSELSQASRQAYRPQLFGQSPLYLIPADCSVKWRQPDAKSRPVSGGKKLLVGANASSVLNTTGITGTSLNSSICHIQIGERPPLYWDTGQQQPDFLLGHFLEKQKRDFSMLLAEILASAGDLEGVPVFVTAIPDDEFRLTVPACNSMSRSLGILGMKHWDGFTHHVKGVFFCLFNSLFRMPEILFPHSDQSSITNLNDAFVLPYLVRSVSNGAPAQETFYVDAFSEVIATFHRIAYFGLRQGTAANSKLNGWRFLTFILSAEDAVVVDATLYETGQCDQGPLLRMRTQLKIAHSLHRNAVHTYHFLLALLPAPNQSFGSFQSIDTGWNDKALDFGIVAARRHCIRLILSLVNNLQAFGGKAPYVRWAKAAGTNLTSSPDFFFWHPTIKGYYKDYITSILFRKNSLRGVKYSQEPAIFAWELMHESRCFSSSPVPVLHSWIAEMAEFIKPLGRKHLVTVGLEGVYGPAATNRLKANPGEWAASLGSDFVQTSAVKFIDFASVHAYPYSWIPHSSPTAKAKYLANWGDTHIYDGKFVLQIPVLFTEVGSTPHLKKHDICNRDLFLKIVYDRICESVTKGQAGAAALIAQLLLEGIEAFGDEYALLQLGTPQLPLAKWKSYKWWPDPFQHKTNGVTPSRCIQFSNPALSQIISKWIDTGDWGLKTERLADLQTIAGHDELHAAWRAAQWTNKLKIVRFDAMFDIQLQRRHEYTRQLLYILGIVYHYQTMHAMSDAEREASYVPHVCLFAGKPFTPSAHAKRIVQFITDVDATINHDPGIGDLFEVVLVPYYIVSVTALLIPVSELSQHNNTTGMGASGTSNVKIAIKGYVRIGTLVGATVEIRQEGGDAKFFYLGITLMTLLGFAKKQQWESLCHIHNLRQCSHLFAMVYLVLTAITTGGTYDSWGNPTRWNNVRLSISARIPSF